MNSDSQMPSPADRNEGDSPKELENLIDILSESEEPEEPGNSQADLAEDLSLTKPQASDRSEQQHSDDEGEIEVEPVKPEPTLKEAVEYEAFMRQTVEPETSEEPETGSAIEPSESIEEIRSIDPDNASSEELADAVNALIPLIIELLHFKLDDSREGIVRAVRPLIDRLIEERTVEDSDKMAGAIARILPSAIASEIRRNPKAIARALAPEVALSIREQIVLDNEAIPLVLGPEMGKAIKAQIESEKDAMVDALYPVIGSTIAKYMVEVVQEINRKVESTLSYQGVRRKIRARTQGVSEAELIFKESVGFRVRAIFLIDKDSGLIIQEIQRPGAKHLDSDLIAGMLTAIRSFANDCISSSSGSELDSIDYGDWQIPLEVAGYCYLAVVVAGEPTPEFINQIRRVLGEIVLEYDEEIQNFDGDLATIPPKIRDKLLQLTEVSQEKPPKPSASPFLLWLIILILAPLLILFGIGRYQGQVARGIEQTVAARLDATPELSVYRFAPWVEKGQLAIAGKVPNEYLHDRARQITREIAKRHNLELDDRIITVKLPANSSLTKGEIERLTQLFNRESNVAISTSYDDKTLVIRGLILKKTQRQKLVEAFRQIPEVEQIVVEALDRLPEVPQRIYFNSGSDNVKFADNSSKINAVKRLLRNYPQLHLKLIGHSDGIGSTQINLKLSQRRCSSVKAALVGRGIEPDRLRTPCSSPSSPAAGDDSTSWSNRYVNFEPFLP